MERGDKGLHSLDDLNFRGLLCAGPTAAAVRDHDRRGDEPEESSNDGEGRHRASNATRFLDFVIVVVRVCSAPCRDPGDEPDERHAHETREKHQDGVEPGTGLAIVAVWITAKLPRDVDTDDDGDARSDNGNDGACPWDDRVEPQGEGEARDLHYRINTSENPKPV